MPDLTNESAPVCSSNIYWETSIKSATSDKHYSVCYTVLPPNAKMQYGYICECLGYQFRGTCKHIKQADKDRCGWGADLTERGDYDECPDCGVPVTYLLVGV